VIALHAARPHQCGWPRFGTALEQPARSTSSAAWLPESAGLVLKFRHPMGAGVRAAQRADRRGGAAGPAGPARIAGCCTCPAAKTPTTSSRKHGAGENTAPCWSKRRSGWTGRSSRRWKARTCPLRPSFFQQAPFSARWWHCWAKLPQSAVRTHYPPAGGRNVSPGGQARLAQKLEEDLRLQVTGERWQWPLGRAGRSPASGSLARAGRG